MKWTIKKPQLKPLLLKESGFHQPAYLTLIKEVMKHKITVEQDFANELQKLGTEMEKGRLVHNDLVLEVEELIKTVNDLTVEYTKTQKEAEELEAKNRNVSRQFLAGACDFEGDRHDRSRGFCEAGFQIVSFVSQQLLKKYNKKIFIIC